MPKTLPEIVSELKASLNAVDALAPDPMARLVACRLQAAIDAYDPTPMRSAPIGTSA